MPEYYLNPNSSCLTSCKTHYYPNKDTNICEKCDSNCVDCFGPSDENCTSCSSELYLNPDNTCLETCPLGYRKDMNKCWLCDDTCRTCTGLDSN